MKTRPKVLFVDDEENLLAGYRRQLRGQFDVETALAGQKGLEVLDTSGPFAVVVSDMRMPEMDGIQFLAKARDVSPDSVRMMLTGQADLQTAINAINEGCIFRFMTKPCPPDALAGALEAGIRQYGLVMAERELLEKTLKNSVKVLTDILSIVNPTAFGRASRVSRTVATLASEVGSNDSWQLEVAAMLSQIGCVTVPQETLSKVYTGKILSADEEGMFEAHPRAGADLITNIPRLDDVAEIIAYQEKCFNGRGLPKDPVKGDGIPLGARILKIALDFDTLTSSGRNLTEAYSIMQTREGWYDPDIMGSLKRILALESLAEIRFVKIEEMSPGMRLGDDVKTDTGFLLITRGQEVTHSLKLRLLNYKRTRGIPEPIKVILHPSEAEVPVA